MSKEKQDIKLEKVDDKTAYENLLVKYAELENQIADIKANCDLAIEGRDIKIKELELELTVEKDQHQEEINLHLHAEDYIKSLEKENAELRNNGFTISGMTAQQLRVAIKEGEQLEKENKKVKQGCHKWFMRWRKVKREELEEISKIEELEQQIEKMKCCANCKSFKGYGETCEGWGEPVLNLNCNCTEWELKEIEK